RSTVLSRLSRSGLLQSLARQVPHRATQIRFAMPLMLDAAHQQGAIKLDRALREQRLVLEEAGSHLFDLQRLDLPVAAAQLQALETRRVGSRGVTQRAGLKERRGFVERAEHGG